MASGRDQDVEETVAAISDGQGTLLDVVKALGEYLTSEEDALRTKGVEFMSAVLSGCPPERFNRQSVKVLVSFLCGQLEDPETVVPALKGLLSLTYLPTFTSGDAVDVFDAILAHVKMKSLVQSQRFIVTIALKGISKRFVPGYISLVNGEKDPRNLVLCFGIDRVLLLEFDVKDHIEDFFNITFCYFPITFRPPPDDPYGITTDDLKNALRKTADTPGLVKDVCHECLDLLKEPEKSQAKPAVKTLCAFLSTTGPVSTYTLAKAVPLLTALFHNPDEASNRTPTLTLLTELVKAARDSAPESESEVKLAQFKDDLLGIMTVGLKNESSCTTALEGLKALVTTKGLMSNDELGYTVHNVNEIIPLEWANTEEIIDSTLDLLSTVSTRSPMHVEGTTLPLLFSTLPDRAPPREAASERAKCWQTLAFLSKLCKQPSLFETLVVRLTTKLDLICGSTAHSQEDIEPSAAYAHSILLTLRNVLKDKVDLGHLDVAKYLDRLATGLHMVASEPRLLKTAGEIITLVVQVIPTPKQQSFLDSLIKAYLHGNAKILALGSLKIPDDQVFQPLEPSAPSLQKNMIVLFSAAIIALHKDVALPVADTSQFLQQLYVWSVHHSETLLQREAAWYSIASVTNKRCDDAAQFLTACQEQIWPSDIAVADRPVVRRRLSISAWTWVTKALATRGHPSAEGFVDRLFEVFDDTDINWDAARALGGIVAADDILTKYNHAVIRILFAQRYCNRLLPQIVEGAKGAANGRQQVAYLVALTSLIKTVPKTTYVSEMPTLIPLLLRGLQLRDPDIRANVISTLHSATDTDPNGSSIIAEHIGTLVSAMLENSKIEEMPSVRVRVAALKYLGLLPKSVRYDKLHPYKSTVLKELSNILDDPKRAVRKEAVDARSNWFTCSG
ncbi:hypothetical protein GLOTRDRAFT_128555 [Gloeophyllum trabeum ATCC 11539]|uniref:MMS19 nucleotide excision repair protein n=1 Tax=Gloeophyllum trabeum (strain ATCC 11539 / FP-39264 / Madison 617) TaxID=670483 RepID=S7QBS8_GLOTA|nr:uncharacterized protein GLOTRDRAFT_128555 [Gloeophyllum trabeum ATCC 11539]EPQ56802.1 hypothetical protein GLOTRDRAFT_128555 [Gloeophyllum trabeum ATCC 11539]